MSFTKRESPRSVFKAAALFAAISLNRLCAQELQPSPDARVDTLVNRRIDGGGVAVFPNGLSEGEERDGGWDLGVIISAAYDSNISLTKEDAKSDVVLSVTPTVAYGKGAKDGLDGGFIRFAYKPTAVAYLQGNADTRIDQEATLSAGIRGKSSSIGYEGTIRRLGDATADVGRQTDRTELDQAVRFAWIPREKLAYELAVGYAASEYDDKDLLGSRELYGELALKYAYSPKTQLKFAYRAGNFAVDGASDQTVQRLGIGLDWQPREKIRVHLETAAEHRSFANGSDVNPVLEGRLDWTPQEGTNLYVSAYQRELASAFFVGQNYKVTGAAVGISQRIGQKWTARLEAGTERSIYKQVEGSGRGGRRDDILFVRPALEYRFTDSFGMEFFYRMAESRSNRDGFGYDQDVAGVRLEYKF